MHCKHMEVSLCKFFYSLEGHVMLLYPLQRQPMLFLQQIFSCKQNYFLGCYIIFHEQSYYTLLLTRIAAFLSMDQDPNTMNPIFLGPGYQHAYGVKQVE